MSNEWDLICQLIKPGEQVVYLDLFGQGNNDVLVELNDSSYVHLLFYYTSANSIFTPWIPSICLSLCSESLEHSSFNFSIRNGVFQTFAIAGNDQICQVFLVLSKLDFCNELPEMNSSRQRLEALPKIHNFRVIRLYQGDFG